MFNMMVVDVVIGNAEETLELMDKTNCRMPERLEVLQKKWREMSTATKTWTDYFANIGATRPVCRHPDEWIAMTVSRAAQKGPKYGGSKGKGKGKGK